MPNTSYYLYGYHCVIAALTNPKRQHKTLYIDDKYQTLITALQKKHPFLKGLTVVIKEKAFFQHHYADANHQYIILETTKLPIITSHDIYEQLQEQDKQTIIMLDGVTDTQNIGAIMRSSLLLGADAVIVPKNGAPNENAPLCKIASGAFDAVLYGQATNLARDIVMLQKQGFWVYAFAGDGAQALHEVTFAPKSILIFGSENKGIRPNVKEKADIVTYIPMHKRAGHEHIESFNVSSSVTIALYHHQYTSAKS